LRYGVQASREKVVAALRAKGLFDGDADGALTEDEVPPPMWERMAKADADGDGSVTASEFELMCKEVSELLDADQACKWKAFTDRVRQRHLPFAVSPLPGGHSHEQQSLDPASPP